MNTMFEDVSAHIEPLDRNTPSSYVPAQTAVPHLYTWEVYSGLKKKKKKIPLKKQLAQTASSLLCSLKNLPTY